MKITFLLSCFGLLLFTATAQTEFLVTVDRHTATHHIVDDLPPVNYIYIGASTVDKNNHRYMFVGRDFGGVNHLYTVDALTGAILHQPVITASNTGELEYDNTGNTLYGITVDTGTWETKLVSFDLATAVPTTLAVLPFSGYMVGSTCFDENMHAYLVQRGTALYAVNTSTGAITSVPAPNTYNELRMDNTTGYAYALIFVSGSMQLVRIHPGTGTFTSLCNISPGFSSGQTTFDEENQYYIFNANGYLVSVDVNTGLVVSDPGFPVGISPPQNVVELNCDNSSGIIYGLHWGQEQATGVPAVYGNDRNFSLYPNPATAAVHLRFDQAYADIGITVYDASGRQVLVRKSHYTTTVECSTAGLAKGIYLVQVVTDRVKQVPIKLVVE